MCNSKRVNMEIVRIMPTSDANGIHTSIVFVWRSGHFRKTICVPLIYRTRTYSMHASQYMESKRLASLSSNHRIMRVHIHSNKFDLAKVSMKIDKRVRRNDTCWRCFECI